MKLSNEDSGLWLSPILIEDGQEAGTPDLLGRLCSENILIRLASARWRTSPIFEACAPLDRQG
jgi:hypothetical protein